MMRMLLYPKSHPWAGFTIIEVAIALAILAIGLTAVLGSMVSLNSAIKTATENERARYIADVLAERLMGADWSDLGTKPFAWHRRTSAPSGTAAAIYEAGLPYVDSDSMKASPTAVIDKTLEFRHRPLVDEPPDAGLYRHLRKTGKGIIDMDGWTFDDFGLPIVNSAQSDVFGEVVTGLSEAPSSALLPTDLASAYARAERYNWLQYLGILEQPSGLGNLRVYLEYYDMEAAKSAQSRTQWRAISQESEEFWLPQSHLQLNTEDEDGAYDLNAIVMRIIVRWDRWNGQKNAEHSLLLSRRR